MPDHSKADPIADIESGRDLLREAWMAASACMRWVPAPRLGEDAADESARALVFVPFIGLMNGIVMAVCDRAAGGALAAPMQSAFTIMLGVLLSGGLFPAGLARAFAALIDGTAPNRAQVTRISGAAAAVAVLCLELLALNGAGSAPARARALVLAMLLSRWAIVPIGYGLKPMETTGLGISYRGGIRFTEFAVSSVIALGLAMGLYDVVGLAAIVAVAVTILGLRLLFSRRLGGVGGNGLAAGAAICELAVLAVAAGISKM